MKILRRSNIVAKQGPGLAHEVQSQPARDYYSPTQLLGVAPITVETSSPFRTTTSHVCRLVKSLELGHKPIIMEACVAPSCTGLPPLRGRVSLQAWQGCDSEPALVCRKTSILLQLRILHVFRDFCDAREPPLASNALSSHRMILLQ